MDKFNEISQSKTISSIKNIEDKILINYNNKVSKTICDELDVDYNNTIVNNLKVKDESEETFKDVSIAVASATTSYARIFISQIKLGILDKGGLIYYSDTGSIVTNIPLDQDLVGDEIGKFKLEHVIKRAYFIRSKTYCLITKSGTPIIKAKGVNNHKLVEQDFIE